MKNTINPGDKVWCISEDCEPQEITVTSLEIFAGDSFRYNIHEPKETSINWFDESCIDVMEERETYSASSVWTTRDKLMSSYRFWDIRKRQAEKKLIELP